MSEGVRARGATSEELRESRLLRAGSPSLPLLLVRRNEDLFGSGGGERGLWRANACEESLCFSFKD